MSSLKNILRKVDVSRCDIDVFPITNSGPNYEEVAKYAHVLGVNLEKTKEISITNSVKASVFRAVKRIKKLLCYVGIDISTIVFKRVAQSLEKKNYDQVIAFQEGQATLLVSYIGHSSKVAWIRCDYSQLSLSKKKVNRDKKVYGSFDKIVCVSDFTKDRFLSIHQEMSSKTIAIHNIIAVERIKDSAIITPDGFELNSEGGFNLVSLGRLAPVKRFTAIPKMAKEMLERGVEFKWYIIGADDSDQINIEREISLNKVAESVILLGNRNNPYPYIAKADALICTSISEACPNVINEAKILGTPIVSSNFGSAREMLIDGEEGLISPIEEMSYAIIRLLTEKGLYASIKKNLSGFSYDNKELLSQIANETSLKFFE